MIITTMATVTGVIWKGRAPWLIGLGRTTEVREVRVVQVAWVFMTIRATREVRAEWAAWKFIVTTEDREVLMLWVSRLTNPTVKTVA